MEDWEWSYYLGFGGTFVVAGLGLYFKPDTSITTWAKEEARERLWKKEHGSE